MPDEGDKKYTVMITATAREAIREQVRYIAIDQRAPRRTRLSGSGACRPMSTNSSFCQDASALPMDTITCRTSSAASCSTVI